MKRLLPLFLLSVLGLASCSSGGPQSASGSPSATPVTRTITVEIVDSIPLSVYCNLDDVKCTARGPVAPDAPLPQVTISNGAGVVLAAQDGPLEGGVASTTGCTVPVTFPKIPVANVYVVTVKAANGVTGERTVQDSGQPAQTISVDM